MKRRRHSDMVWFVALFSLVAASLSPIRGMIAEGGGGILYGTGYAFFIQAPKGWIFDNESGSKDGLDAVLYPAGKTWKDAQVVIYARSRPRTEKIQTAEDAAQTVVEDFRGHGNPDSKKTKAEILPTKDGKKEAAVYYFSGDRWGNFEASAYIVEEKQINFYVLSARDRESFEKSLEAFETVVKGYLALDPALEKERAGPAKDSASGKESGDR